MPVPIYDHALARRAIAHQILLGSIESIKPPQVRRLDTSCLLRRSV